MQADLSSVDTLRPPEQPVRVVMFDAAFPPPIVGGKERQAFLLATHLDRLGIPVRALTFAHSGGGPGEEFGTLRFQRSLRGVVTMLRRLVMLRTEYNVCHIHTPSRIGLLVLCTARLAGYRVVFKIPNQSVLLTRSRTGRRIYSRLLQMAHRVVVLEGESRRLLLENGVSTERVASMVNGVESPGRIAGRAVEPDLLAFVARLAPQKRCDDFIELLSTLRDGGRSIRGVVLGDGPEREKVAATIRQRGLTDICELKGFSADPWAHAGSSLALIQCSEHEGMPNAVLEAMIRGIPVIATDVGATGDLVRRSGFPEFVVGVGDVGRMRQLVERLVDTPHLRCRYGTALRSVAEAEFSMEAVSSQYRTLYGGLVSQARGVRRSPVER